MNTKQCNIKVEYEDPDLSNVTSNPSVSIEIENTNGVTCDNKSETETIIFGKGFLERSFKDLYNSMVYSKELETSKDVSD